MNVEPLVEGGVVKMVKMSMVKRVLLGMFFMGLLMLGLQKMPVINALGTLTYSINNPWKNFDMSQCNFYVNFPTSDPPQTYQCPYSWQGRSYNFNNPTQIKPYDLIVSYSFDPVEWHSCDNGHYPFLQIITSDGQNYKTYYGGSGSFTLPKGRYFYCDMYTGEWDDGYWNLLGFNHNYKSYNCRATISIIYDNTSPNIPVLNLNNSTNNPRVKNIGGTYYSGLNPTVIQWNDPGDPGSPSSGVTKYNIYVNGNYVTQVTEDSNNRNNNTYQLTTEGSYSIQVVALDNENIASPLSTAINVVVDYTPPTININKNSN